MSLHRVESKKLYHDVSDAIWTGLELFADPSSTLAFAEVTAYLCFALEMEDEIHHHKQPMSSRQWAAQKRRERDAYQRNTYVNREMTDDPNTTVEQVMMSSLGGGEKLESSSLPSNVVLNESSNEAWLSGETDEAQEEMNWRERASDDIDLHFLQEQITKRAASLEEERENKRRRNKPDSLDTSLQSQLNEAKQPTPQASNETTNQPDRQSTSRGSDIEEMVVTTVDENDDDTEYAEETPVTNSLRQ